MAIVEKTRNRGQDGRGGGASLTLLPPPFHLLRQFPEGRSGAEVPTAPIPHPRKGSVLRIRLSTLIPVLLIFQACSSPEPREPVVETIDRELFLAAYVELRVAALEAEDQQLSVAARDRILERVGVEDEDLLRFVEVHGEDVQLMRRIWEEVDSILEARRRPPEGEDQPPGG